MIVAFSSFIYDFRLHSYEQYFRTSSLLCRSPTQSRFMFYSLYSYRNNFKTPLPTPPPPVSFPSPHCRVLRPCLLSPSVIRPLSTPLFPFVRSLFSPHSPFIHSFIRSLSHATFLIIAYPNLGDIRHFLIFLLGNGVYLLSYQKLT